MTFPLRSRTDMTAPTPETVWAKALDLQNRVNGLVSGGMSSQWTTSSINQTGSYQNVFSTPSLAVGTWRVHGCWQVGAGGGPAPTWMQFTGPATSLVFIQVDIPYASTPWQAQITGGWGIITGPSIPASFSGGWHFDGLFTTTAAGQVFQQMRGNGTNNWWVNPGSFMDVWQVG